MTVSKKPTLARTREDAVQVIQETFSLFDEWEQQRMLQIMRVENIDDLSGVEERRLMAIAHKGAMLKYRLERTNPSA